jgi:hypothetical protein
MLESVYGKFENNWVHTISIRSVKMIDIAYLFGSSSIIGYIVARILSNMFVFNENNYKDKEGKVTLKYKFKLGFHIIGEMAIIGICIYISRQIIQLLPFPLDGWKGFGTPEGFLGYKHKKLREWENPYPIAFFIILFQDHLKAKIAYFTKINNF